MRRIPLKYPFGALIVVLCLGLVLIPFEATGKEARLESIIVTNTRDDLLVFLNVEGAFTEKMEKAALTGVPITFSFFIHLYRVRNLWPDKKISSLKTSHTLKYNSLKKEYMVKRLWDSEKTFSTQSLQEAQKFMTEIEGIKIAGLKDLQKGEQYQIRVKAELNKKTLPLYLHHVLFFVSLWDFETDWYTIDFIY
jgi:hypothetical protein